MKSLIQTYLIGGGVLGLVVSVPFAGFCCVMWRGFDGKPANLVGIIGVPVVCIVAIVAGVLWKRAGQKIQRSEAEGGKPVAR